MDSINRIKELINQGNIDSAILQLESYIQTDSERKDEAYYLLGNAYRKRGDWATALNHYQSAIDLNPQSPATEARKMAMDIMNFFNQDYI
jgi:tetratricopeptide (TPR) repeat protein